MAQWRDWHLGDRKFLSRASRSAARGGPRSRSASPVRSSMDMELYGLGLDFSQRYNDLVNAIRPKDVLEAVQKYLDPDNMAETVAGPVL